jgi:hypothetical protein
MPTGGYVKTIDIEDIELMRLFIQLLKEIEDSYEDTLPPLLDCLIIVHKELRSRGLAKPIDRSWLRKAIESRVELLAKRETI